MSNLKQVFLANTLDYLKDNLEREKKILQDDFIFFQAYSANFLIKIMYDKTSFFIE